MTKMGSFRLFTRSSTFYRSDEFSYRTVIGSLGLGGKETAWNFAVPTMISHALAAFAPARTGFIRAGAFFQIFFEIAFHNPPQGNSRFKKEKIKIPLFPIERSAKKKGRPRSLPFFALQRD
jgi:hypothetical protein